MRKRFALSRIRQNYSYAVQDICHALGVHKNTVREWFRSGLPKIDDQRPYLIHGKELKAFLSARQASRRSKCALHEFYCFRCRGPRRAMGNLVDIEPHNEKTVMLLGYCEACETLLRKLQSRKALAKLFQVFGISTQQQEHIRECLKPRLNCDFVKESKQ
jgi:hypothetical protein